MITLKQLKKELKTAADPKRAEVSKRYFKTGKGEYGEGDIFIGLSVPQRKRLAKKYKDFKLTDILKLLRSKIHEERNIALLVLEDKFNRFENQRKEIFEIYLNNTKHINNWDLIDLSAGKIVGGYLFIAQQSRLSDDARLQNPKHRSSNSTSLSKIRHPSIPKPNFSSSESGLSRSEKSVNNLSREEFRPIFVLTKLAKSKSLWERRIAIMATACFIKNNQFGETLKIAKMLLQDKHDLIHKAVGWMLREVGKKDLKTEIEFLNKHYQKMPRTMLRYAIEKFPENLRLKFLAK